MRRATALLEDQHYIMTSPLCDQSKIELDQGAQREGRDDENAAPISRHDSPEAFRDRVYSAVLEGAAASVAAFSNLGEVISHYPDQRVYCFFMFSIEKEPCS